MVEITSVVPMTRSCRERRQRRPALAMAKCSQRSAVRKMIVTRCGSQETNQRTTRLRRMAISQPSRRYSRCERAGALAWPLGLEGRALALASAPGTPEGAAGAGLDVLGVPVGRAGPAASGVTADGSIPVSTRSGLVPHAAHRDDDLWVLRILLDLRAQPLDMHVD